MNPFANRSNRDPAAYRAPAPAPGGIQGWVTSKINALRNKRTAGGAYESTSYGGASGRDHRGFGPLDPDEAWDSRVGNEADYYGGGAGYEEQELGLQDPGRGAGLSGYGGHSGVGVGGIPEDRGRSRSRQRELDERYDEEVHGSGGMKPTNPFGDDAEAASLRAASPRPVVETGRHQRGQSSLGTQEDSPTERRSMFREDV